jgi:GAF domain-containing protein
MNEQPIYQNVYTNVVTGATANPVMPEPDAIDDTFAQAANQVLILAAELARELVGAHQSAIAIIVQGDWSTVRKVFSLSEKYLAWKDYNTPATGYGSHNWAIQQKDVIRLTQAELEAHPEWRHFGTEAGKHPPMRGWMAVPLIDKEGTNWGLFQLSDKYEGEFSVEDEKHFVKLAALTLNNLDALWQVRNLQKAAAGKA